MPKDRELAVVGLLGLGLLFASRASGSPPGDGGGEQFGASDYDVTTAVEGSTAHVDAVPVADAPVHMLDVQWGDGSSNSTQASNGQLSASHTYSADGTYNLTINIFPTSDHAAITVTDSVTVSSDGGGGGSNNPPIANLSVSKFGGGEVTASGEGSFDLGGTITNYEFDFGDGTVISGTDKAVTYTYSTNATYTVCLTVTDDGGATASDCTDVNITNAGN